MPSGRPTHSINQFCSPDTYQDCSILFNKKITVPKAGLEPALILLKLEINIF